MQGQMVAIAVLVAACGGPTVSQPGIDARAGDDAGGEVDAAIGEIPDAGPAACTFLENSGPPIALETVQETAPAAQGGTIVPGTYRLTRHQVFVGPGGSGGTATARATLRFTADHHFDEVMEHSVFSGFRARGTWVTNQTMFSPTVTCDVPAGAASAIQHQFTATDTTYEIHSGQLVLTFTLVE
jgi:hypothetical protein